MRVWIPIDATRQKYGNAWSAKIAAAAGDLGTVADVSGKTPEELRALIHAVAVNEPHVLIGGYDLLPPFTRVNPTLHLSGDDDETIPTDDPYAATPDVRAQEYAPPRIVARIPDATGTGDPADFIKLLRFQADALTAVTPAKRFDECAAEFIDAANVVAAAISPSKASILQSPPARLKGNPDIITRLTGSGRVHVLLHGANFWRTSTGNPRVRRITRAHSQRGRSICAICAVP